MRDYQNGVSVADQVLVFKKIGILGTTLVSESLDSSQNLIYVDEEGVLKFKNSNGVFTLGGGDSLITVADEAARYALTGISPGQLVLQTDNSTTYRLLAPSTAQGGVAVLGGSQDGIFQNSENTDKTGNTAESRMSFILLGSDTSWITYTNLEDIGGPSSLGWVIRNNDSVYIYYSLSDTPTPDLATDWKNASDDSPASITVTSITEGELNAGVTVDSETSGANGSLPVVGNAGSRNVYGPSTGSVYFEDGEWYIDDFGVGIAYSVTSSEVFPWEVDWSVNSPAPTVTRNDICVPANWEEV